MKEPVLPDTTANDQNNNISDTSTHTDLPILPDNRWVTNGPPGWVKALMIGFIILVVLFVIMHLMGLGFGNHLTMPSINQWVPPGL